MNCTDCGSTYVYRLHFGRGWLVCNDCGLHFVPPGKSVKDMEKVDKLVRDCKEMVK